MCHLYLEVVFNGKISCYFFLQFTKNNTKQISVLSSSALVLISSKGYLPYLCFRLQGGGWMAVVGADVWQQLMAIFFLDFKQLLKCFIPVPLQSLMSLLTSPLVKPSMNWRNLQAIFSSSHKLLKSTLWRPLRSTEISDIY